MKTFFKIAILLTLLLLLMRALRWINLPFWMATTPIWVPVAGFLLMVASAFLIHLWKHGQRRRRKTNR